MTVCRGVVIYLGDIQCKAFGNFIMLARELNKEMAFGHIDAKTYSTYDLHLLEREEGFADTPGKFSLFMFRRGNFQD